MGKIQVTAERTMEAAPERIYGFVADYREHHPRFLPEAFSDLQVESGGVGEGTVLRFTLNAGGRSRAYRMAVGEPEPGRVLEERDTGSSLVTTWTVFPQGAGCRVKIESSWDGAGGIGGFFERIFAPATLRRLYRDELSRLAAYAAEQAAQGPSA